MITDLDKELPEGDIVKFKDKQGNLYNIEMIIPIDVGNTIIENIDIIQRIFPKDGGRPKPTIEAYEFLITIIADICHSQYEEIDREWIRKNVSLTRLIIIIYQMSKPIYQFLTSSGFMEFVK